MTEKISNCPTCGAKTVSYKHSLSKVLMKGFRKVLECSGVFGRFDIANCNLTYSERENLRKLQYWGLIKKAGDKARGGRWQVTALGLDFACGHMHLPYTVRTYRGDVLGFSGDDVSIEDVAGGWKYRPDYALEARPALEIQRSMF